jgi:nickel-dependent lactate racemase
MALYCGMGSEAAELTSAELREALAQALAALGDRRRILVVPPDASRFHSRAGELTQMTYELCGSRVLAVLPALGTHTAMDEAALKRMFGDMPRELFRVHHWREDVVTLGEVPASLIREVSEGRLNYAYPVQVNRLLVEGPGDGAGFDLILSIGQVVPHEVIGMANYNKNILVGTGGVESIDRSHYLGAVYGMERMMGRADTPVRRVLNYASERFLTGLPIVYVLTVVGRNAEGSLVVRGLFIGDDQECFLRASELAVKVNITILDREITKAVVYLDPHEFHSTWLGNKAIYRTRMALADDAELVVLASGVKEFGEDPAIDRLIRKYGYRGTPATLEAVRQNADLAGNLSAAAHLIHGSSEGRFRITYCPGALSREEIEGVGFGYADLPTTAARYNPSDLKDGWNTVGGEEIFFVSNPGLGLWATEQRFAP